MPKKILFIGGSLNQTTMMHQIAQRLPEHDCSFTPFFADGLLGWLSRTGLLNFTILGGRHRQATLEYLVENDLPVDFGGRTQDYDLIITATDTYVPPSICRSRLILVQEGILLPEGLMYRLVRRFNLPRILANTAVTGLSHAYDLFCVASTGFREVFIRKGVRADKIAVTGIPNFDDAASYLQNDFPHHGYVLATTAALRDSFMADDRAGFIRLAQRVAAGRQLIFKLHPNEDHRRAVLEIQKIAPQALILTAGNVNHMIANCAVMVTQYSSVVLVGLALGKEIHADFDLKTLRALTPLQNGGTSAEAIARLSRKLMRIPLQKLSARRLTRRPAWKLPNTINSGD